MDPGPIHDVRRRVPRAGRVGSGPIRDVRRRAPFPVPGEAVHRVGSSSPHHAEPGCGEPSRARRCGRTVSAEYVSPVGFEKRGTHPHPADAGIAGHQRLDAVHVRTLAGHRHPGSSRCRGPRRSRSADRSRARGRGSAPRPRRRPRRSPARRARSGGRRAGTGTIRVRLLLPADQDFLRGEPEPLGTEPARLRDAVAARRSRGCRRRPPCGSRRPARRRARRSARAGRRPACRG